VARQRFIHPDLWDDKKIAKMSFLGRLFFIGCFSNADDEGRILGDPNYLRSTIFKYDDMSLKKIIQIREEVLSKNTNLCLYEVDGEEYLYFKNWKEYQKPKYPTPSKIPAPPVFEEKNSGNDSGNTSETTSDSFPYGLGLGLGNDLGLGRGGIGEGEKQPAAPAEETKIDRGTVMTFFDKNIHPISEVEAQELHCQMDEGMEPIVVIMAIKEAVLNGARNMKYILTVLDTWRDNNAKTKEAVIAYKRDWADKHPKKNKSSGDSRAAPAQKELTLEEKRENERLNQELQAMAKEMGLNIDD
jgi:DnaD/phage-associated family protein